MKSMSTKTFTNHESEQIAREFIGALDPAATTQFTYRADVEGLAERLRDGTPFFEIIEAAEIPYGCHCSDLYVPDTEAVRALLRAFPLYEKNARRFTNRKEPHKGERWIEIPFAFIPWWKARAR
jgi:hypothetical protein